MPRSCYRILPGRPLATVRATLSMDVFAEAFAAGQQVSLKEAFATILDPTAVAAE